MTYLNFNSKETYLVAFAQWKADYNELSQKIRDTRKEFVDAARAFSKIKSGNGYGQAWSAMEKLRDEKAKLANDARTLLTDRSRMKAQAAVQYSEQKYKSTCDYVTA